MVGNDLIVTIDTCSFKKITHNLGKKVGFALLTGNRHVAYILRSDEITTNIVQSESEPGIT